jgi:hypothetical protein
MQIKNTTISIVSPPPTTETKSVPANFAGVFDSSLARMGRNKNTADTASISHDRIAPEKTNLIKLGKISSAQPTVSHLSINHPEYGDECWKIIHSDINKDKPYNRIPEGTKIYLDPESKEITWDNSNHDRAGIRTINSSHASGRTRTPQQAETVNYSAKKPSGHVSGTTAVNPFSASQRIKVNEQHLIDQSVSRASTRHNLPRELIMAVIKAESDFQARAVSPAGAQGLMQLMPATARELGVKNSFDIRENIEGGARYLKKMLETFNGNLEQALAAYNAGPGAVRKYQGQVPFQETKLYVKRVLSFLNHFK